MDNVYEELDEAKTEIEKLKAELRAKTDSFERLKKSHDVYVNQTQEAKYKAEKLDEELLQKADEIAQANQMYEDLKVNLHRKESIIKDLSAANDKLRVDCDEKFRMWEHEKGGMVSALEEANEKAENQGQQIYVYRQEIESLRGCLSVSKKKCSEVEKNLTASIERSEREEMFHKLEEEKRKVEDQLKWKKEQFKHLEEAHEKLREQFRSSKKEWEMEKSTLLDEISSLQIKLDSQIRISGDLQHQLQSCHQALAHVESQKKRLEVEVSDFKARFDNASSESQDARLQLDSSNSQHDNDIADLRYSLKTKEAYYKESKYRIEKLEQENLELKMSIKELQEAQIQAYSHSKLRSKLRNLEQVHKECAPALQAKEAEWNFQLEQLTGELNSCQSELETKIAAVEGLKMDLERSHMECASTLKAKEAEWNFQLKQLTGDLNRVHKECAPALQAKEAEWNFQLEQLTGELNSCQSELETKIAVVEGLKMDLERSHMECASTLKAKEAEWNFQLKQLTGELNSCQSELETKIAAVEELKMELERSHSLTIEMKLLNEEMTVMLLVLKQGISEAQLKLANHIDEKDLTNREKEEKYFQLMKQLDLKDAALISVQNDINEERERAACLTRQVESLQYEIDRYKEMLEESTMCQLRFKEKVMQMECDSKEQLEEVLHALDNANIELHERICERNEMELELQIWKSIVERLKNDLEESHMMRKELETALLAQVDDGESLKQEKDSLVYMLEEKERRIDYLQRHVLLLELEKKAMGESGVLSESDNVRYIHNIEEKDKILEELQEEVVRLVEQESFRREFESVMVAESTMEKISENEKENLIQLIKGKDVRINELMQQVTSLEQQFTNSLTTFSSQIAKKEVEINLIQEAYDKITACQILAALEIEEKKLMIVELEEYIHDIQQKLKLKEEMEGKQLEVKELNDQMENKLGKSNALIQKLKMENRNLLENAARLSLERENLLSFVQGLGDKVSEFSTADTQLMDMLRSMVQSFENDDCPRMNLKKDDAFLVKENMLIHSPSRIKKLEDFSDIRSPFKELNS